MRVENAKKNQIVIIEALQNILGEDRAERAAKSLDLLGEGYLDSYAFLELTAVLEEALDVMIPATKLTPQNYASVDTLTAMCESLTSD